MSFLTVNNKPLPLLPDYSCFRMLLAGAHWTPQTPRYVWGWWMKSVLVLGWILQFSQHFPIFFAFLWVKQVQIWGWWSYSKRPWLLVTSLFCWLGHFGEIMRNSVYVVLTINTQILQLDKFDYDLTIFGAKLFDDLPLTVYKLSNNYSHIFTHYSHYSHYSQLY